MKFSVTITLFLFLFPFISLAQSGTEDVVYLKNGSVLRGEIVELIENDHLKIEIAGRNIFAVMMDDVEKITSEKLTIQRHYKKTGYMNRTGFELLHSGGDSSIRVTMVNGYRFNPHLSAGIGFGITPYNDPLTLIPVFLELNLRFLKANSSPYLFLKTGYNFSVHHDDNMEILDHHGGLLFNPGVGLHFIRSSGTGWYFQAGYNIDNSYYEFEGWWPQTVENDLSFRRVSLGMGLSF